MNSQKLYTPKSMALLYFAFKFVSRQKNIFLKKKPPPKKTKTITTNKTYAKEITGYMVFKRCV